MRRRTAASIRCWVGSPWPRLIGIGATVATVVQAAPAFAQPAGEQTVGVAKSNAEAAPAGNAASAQPTNAAANAGTTPAANEPATPPAVIPAPAPAEPEPAPVASPNAAAATSPEAVKPVTGSSATVEEPLLTEDELTVSGYMPGYRRHVSLGMSPNEPRTDAFAGGVTPAFGSPKSVEDWSFKWSGYMNLSLQPSLYKRRNVMDGQSTWVTHTPPMTIDEYASFTSTATVPGNWVNLNLQYGNSKVNAIVSIDTWNPSQPTSYYQLGSQYFIHNAYLSYSPETIGGVRLHCNAGFFAVSYGNLSRYGSGIYVNPVAGLLRGAGELITAEYDISDKVMITAEHGIMMPRNGRAPDNIISSPANGYLRPTWPASWIHHAHAGFVIKTEPRIQFQAHYIKNWAQDERVQMSFDNPVTRQMNETDIKDGSISVYAADARLISETYGYLAAGVAYLDMKHAFPIKGVLTYGGDGENLTDRWLGVPSNGTGQMLVSAINYGFSLGKIVAHPRQFAGDGPDIVVNTGFHWATTWQDFAAWNRRDRYKGGLDVLYTFLRNVGFGTRVDAVVPNSKDMDETFYVLASRIQLKTDWTSREQINLIYARWFYGSRTRNEGTGERTPERLDSQLLALNFNMWW